VINRATATDYVVASLISLKQVQPVVMNARKRRRFDAIVWSAALLIAVVLVGKAHYDSHRWSGHSPVQVVATALKSGGTQNAESAR
jgi:hypothetical protein